MVFSYTITLENESHKYKCFTNIIHTRSVDSPFLTKDSFWVSSAQLKGKISKKWKLFPVGDTSSNADLENKLPLSKYIYIHILEKSS